MAKLVSAWRYGGAQNIFAEWERLYSRSRALQCARTLPPRVLRGRWGLKSGAEWFLSRCGLPELRSVFCNPFDSNAEGDADDAGNAGGAEHEVGIIDPDETTNSKRGRKWSHEVCRALHTPACWCKRILGHVWCRSAGHVSAWIKKPLESGRPPAYRALRRGGGMP